MQPRLATALVFLASLAVAACGSDGGTSAGTDTLGADAVASDAVDDAVDDASGEDATAEDTGGDDTAVADTTAADTTTPLEAFTAPGPYNVGYRTETLTYTPAGDTEERTLRVAYWYPTRDTEGDNPLYAGLLAAPGAFVDAAPVADVGALPVLLFSHGNGGFAEQSSFFTEFLASHGFFVAAVDHTTNTFIDIQNDADPRIFRWRPQDISALLDHVEALPAEHPLHGLPSDAVALAGHSFGGYTTFAVGGVGFGVDLMLAYCQANELPNGACETVADDEALYRAGFYDARISALVPMAPAGMLLFTGGFDTIVAPMLLMTGAMDETTPNATEGNVAWSNLSGEAGNLRIDFATAGHFTFSDACELDVGAAFEDGCGEAFLDADAAHTAIDAYALAFLRLQLLGDTGGVPLLDGTVSIEDDVTLSVGAP
ncbi:MAG: hypothetical protein EP329_25495 [Deltaproteobacteria bacterium]|nr:MAG: hypothetical protein EP329_25495 [Deltaproteobacteria bacterium]